MSKLWISGYYWGANIGILPPSKVAAGLGTMTRENLLKRAYRKIKKLF